MQTCTGKWTVTSPYLY